MPDPRDKQQAKMRARKHKNGAPAPHEESAGDDLPRDENGERTQEAGGRE